MIFFRGKTKGSLKSRELLITLIAFVLAVLAVLDAFFGDSASIASSFLYSSKH